MNPERILLHNAELVLPDRLAEGGVLVEAGRIQSVLVNPRAWPEADRIIDLEGDYLAPGFIDLHIHGASGVDLMTAGPEAVSTLGRFLLRSGTTRFLPTAVPDSDAAYLQVISAIEEAMRQPSEKRSAAAIVGIHFEGPFLSPGCHGALDPARFRTFRTATDLQPFLAGPIRQAGGVAMMTLAPELEGGLDLITELRGNGIIAAIGHSQAPFEICDAALARGARHVTHYPNGLAPLHHRESGVAVWALLQDQVTIDVIADGIHVDRRMLSLIHKIKSAEKMGLISDAIPACGLPDGTYQVWGEPISVCDRRTSNASGRLAGSVITVLDAVSNLAHWGFPLVDIFRMSSQVPASVLGVGDELGSISEGKRADLIGLDHDLRVRLAAVDGWIERFV
ncbi:MAG: N-acetylglucosamine-6-phosphate deacetylase [Acidobacteria bacterium]|nr:N-acetylglucosamine-6-phosphate deacetylase [Acidobacteriota bacterium]